MRKEKRERLERAGWRVGDTADFLGLAPAEAAYLELRVQLGRRVGSGSHLHHVDHRELELFRRIFIDAGACRPRVDERQPGNRRRQGAPALKDLGRDLLSHAHGDLDDGSPLYEHRLRRDRHRRPVCTLGLSG